MNIPQDFDSIMPAVKIQQTKTHRDTTTERVQRFTRSESRTVEGKMRTSSEEKYEKKSKKTERNIGHAWVGKYKEERLSI